MEEIFEVKIRGIHKDQRGISFSAMEVFESYPTKEELKVYFDSEMKDKSLQFKQNFNWRITIDKVFIPEI